MTDFANAIPTTVDVVRRERCYEGFYKLDRLHLRHELFAGGMSREINREVFVRHDAVCMLPYDPQRDEVVLIEQFRVGAMGKTDNPWLVELVAGLIDKDEQPEEVAHREAQEEAGLDIKALWPMTKYFRRRAAVTSLCICIWGVAAPKALAACMAWKKRQKISASRSGLSKMPCRPSVTVALPTRRASSPCNGWR